MNRLVIIFGAFLVSGGLGLIGVAKADDSRSHEDDKESCSTDPIEKYGLSTPEECYRECRVDEPPKTCYYHFTVEYYSVLGEACQLCTPNDTNILSDTCQCVTADGIERTILVVNRKLPGPSIQVCLGDKVVIDTKNDLDGMQLTIHWHGILQELSPYYDGVPYVTQCPISQGNTFRYQWLANNEGTHFWHAHTGMTKMDGVHGSLIVRVPRSEEPNGRLYDYDKYNHVIFMEDWTHELTAEHFPGLQRLNPFQQPDSLLINGKGTYTDPVTGNVTTTPLQVYRVKSGRRYRFRIINSFCSTCIGQLTIGGHTPLLISADGVPVKPVKINTINSVAGERYDIVINANQRPGCYYISLRGIGTCASLKIIQLARLCYEDDEYEYYPQKPTYENPTPPGILLGPLDGLCNVTRANNICISQLRSARPVDKDVVSGPADQVIHFDVGFYNYRIAELFKEGTYQRYSSPAGGILDRAMVNNISYVSLPSPPLSQIDDIPAKLFCNPKYPGPNCGGPRACAQIHKIRKGSVVEMVLADGVGVNYLTHPVHMHGYAYNVIGMGRSPYKNVRRMGAQHARDLDRKHLLCRNADRPPHKDTVAVPQGGYVVIRFRANNPGYWLMHCHFLFHQLIGMEMLLHVGERGDVPPVPRGFPKCGNFLPDIEDADYSGSDGD